MPEGFNAFKTCLKCGNPALNTRFLNSADSVLRSLLKRKQVNKYNSWHLALKD